MQQVPDPATVLAVHRPVHAVLVVEEVDRLLRGEPAEHVPAHVAGEQLRRGERDDAQEHERHNREAEALEEESTHRSRGAEPPLAQRPGPVGFRPVRQASDVLLR